MGVYAISPLYSTTPYLHAPTAGHDEAALADVPQMPKVNAGKFSPVNYWSDLRRPCGQPCHPHRWKPPDGHGTTSTATRTHWRSRPRYDLTQQHIHGDRWEINPYDLHSDWNTLAVTATPLTSLNSIFNDGDASTPGQHLHQQNLHGDHPRLLATMRQHWQTCHRCHRSDLRRPCGQPCHPTDGSPLTVTVRPSTSTRTRWQSRPRPDFTQQHLPRWGCLNA